MSDTPDLSDLLAIQPRSRRRFSPVVAKARQAEQARRNGRAQAKAIAALCRLHPDDYRSLYQQAQTTVERGPLPGDPDYVGGTP